MAIFAGGTPIGAPIVGRVADTLGPRWALGVGALAGLVAALIGLWYLRMSNWHGPEASRLNSFSA
jgi:MFS family permease